MALNDNSQFNADGAGSNDHQSGWLRALAMNALGLLPGQGGSPSTALPPGRAAAASSVPVVLATEDKTALDRAPGIYSNSVQYAGATTAGDGILIIATVAGTATVTMSGGGTLVVPAPVGATLLPLRATNVVQTTGTLTAHKLTI